MSKTHRMSFEKYSDETIETSNSDDEDLEEEDIYLGLNLFLQNDQSYKNTYYEENEIDRDEVRNLSIEEKRKILSKVGYQSECEDNGLLDAPYIRMMLSLNMLEIVDPEADVEAWRQEEKMIEARKLSKIEQETEEEENDDLEEDNYPGEDEEEDREKEDDVEEEEILKNSCFKEIMTTHINILTFVQNSPIFNFVQNTSYMKNMTRIILLLLLTSTFLHKAYALPLHPIIQEQINDRERALKKAIEKGILFLDEVTTNIKHTKTTIRKKVVTNINDLVIMGEKNMNKLKRTWPNNEECKNRKNMETGLSDVKRSQNS